MDEVLSCLAKAGLTLNISKCKLFTTTIEYLGYVIRPGKFEIDKANTKSLREALPPTIRTQPRSFLGLVNVYQRFIEKFSTKAGPLNELLRRDSPEKFQLNDKQLVAFRLLIDEVLSPAIFTLPVSGLPYNVDTDASAYEIGRTLYQTHENNKQK